MLADNADYCGEARCVNLKVVGDDAIMVNPTMLASWGKRVASVKVLGEDAVDIIRRPSEDILLGVQYPTNNRGLTMIASSPTTFRFPESWLLTTLK